ncbi:hypothetical protein [Candidatus Aalborgicola defluviihabitans]|uniref:hypothetical protein n=1 Tax=Candidatus Aalborgicola defluviihabitans TaxID=3386187 RepID=UPI00390A92BF|nr:hypothetical protein [Burkholderiales bacterium]
MFSSCLSSRRSRNEAGARQQTSTIVGVISSVGSSSAVRGYFGVDAASIARAALGQMA